jgi:hypothetical protein
MRSELIKDRLPKQPFKLNKNKLITKNAIPVIRKLHKPLEELKSNIPPSKKAFQDIVKFFVE